MKSKPMHPLKRLQGIRKECRQIINDIEYWNRVRTDCTPIDCEPERIMLALADACIAAWGTPQFDELAKDIAEYGRQIQKEMGPA